ncbi:MAG: hypothetical protein ABFR53_00990 [Actinomycetota bacterium]
MKTVVALIISLGVALAVAAKVGKTPAPPQRPAGSWEPADTATR